MDKKKFCNCLNACPCYPNCDQMMDGGSFLGIPPVPGNAPMPGMPQPDVPIGRWGTTTPPPRRTDQMMRPSPWMEQRRINTRDPGPATQTTRMISGLENLTMPSDGDSAILEEENERDWQKLKEQCPDMAKIILAEVEKTCDSMEYEGSMMFDSMPDKVRVLKLTEDIYEKVKDRYPVEEVVDQDDIFVMNQEDRRRHPPKQNWLSDFVQTLLYQEMFRRRCRHRGCKRW